MVKDADEQPDREVPRARSGRVPSIGASVPEAHYHPGTEMCSPI